MSTRIRYAVADVLWMACGVLDWLPAVRRADDESWRSLRFFRHGQLGCHPLRLARAAARLEGRDR